MKTLQALIFDVDGTLAETERDGHRPAFNAAFFEAGLAWHWDAATYGELLKVTGGKERMLHYVQTQIPSLAQDPTLPALIQTLHQTKTRHYLRRVSEGRIPLRPGVAELIRAAHAEGLILAIATTTTAENVTALLRHTLGEEALSWFSVIGAGDVVPAKKPAPDIYQWVLARLGLPTSNCLAIEDSPAGLAAARAAGLDCLVTPGEYTQDEDFRGATWCRPDLCIHLDDLRQCFLRKEA